MLQTHTYSLARDRYDLIRPIAESQSSTVWLAHDQIADDEVVVKRLADTSNPISRKRLAAEVELSKRISHPGLVPVIDHWFADDDAALVFPFVPGKTLAEQLREEGAIQPPLAARVALELADVLAAGHAANVVHRDVKPANVLLGDDGRTRLVDFGIAADGSPDPNAVDVTGSGLAIGTLPYMSPEQLTGADSTPAADVYSLGVVMYEMLTGARPYNAGSPAEQLRAQQVPPARIDAPASLASLTMAALDPVPERRPSAGQVGQTLRAWLDGRAEPEAETEQVAIPAASIPGGPDRRKIASVALGVGAAVLVAALAVAALVGNGLPAGNESVPPGDAAVLPVPPASERPSPTPAEASTPAPRPPVAAANDGSAGVRDVGTRATPDANPAHEGNSAPDRSGHGKHHDNGRHKGHENGRGHGHGHGHH